MKSDIGNEDVEWAYAFDVHLNAYFPALMILHAVQFFFYHSNRNLSTCILSNFTNLFKLQYWSAKIGLQPL